MEDQVTNRVNMINTTVKYSDDNPTPTSGMTAFGNAKTAVKGKMVLVNGLNQIGGGSTKGVTTDTNLLRLVMQQMGLKCAKATLAYANTINNNTLKALVNFNEKKLKEAKKEDVDDICQGIHDATDANIGALGPFGLVAADVSDLQVAINLYRTATQNPRNAIINKSQAKKQAKAIVKDIVKTYFEGLMDLLVDSIKVTEKNFWDGYRQAREIIDLGHTTAKVRGDVRDVNTAPLKDVKFTIYEVGTGNKVRVVLTNAKGAFNAAKLPSGDFDFKWELAGYKTKTETNVHIGPGKELKRKVTLEAGAVVVLEGDLGMGGIVNVDISALEDMPITKVTVEAIGSNFRVYGSPMPNAAPSVPSIDLIGGQSVVKTQEQFVLAIGLTGSNTFVNVQNSGAMPGHWRITFEA